MSFSRIFKTGRSQIALLILIILIAIGGFYSYKKYNKNSKGAAGEMAASEVMILDKNDKISNVGDVETVVAQWIRDNPEAVFESLYNMQKKMMQQQSKDAQKNILSKKNEIFNKNNSASHSPKDYDVSIVEFFDYNCGYCKKAQPTVETLLKSDKKIRFIFREFPILGQASEDLAAVSIAVNMMEPDKYLKFHNALMKGNAHNKKDAIKIAKDSVGIDSDKLSKFLKDKKDEIGKQIAYNRELGASIGINGTPAFIIGEELVSGAVDLDVLQEKIAALRENK